MSLRRRSLAALVSLLTVLGCGRSNDARDVEVSDAATPRASSASSPASPSVGRTIASAPFDVGAAMRRAHFAFAPSPGERDGFDAGHRTHGVHATSRGVRFTPAIVGTRRAGAALELETKTIARGDRAISGDGGARVETEGTLAIARGEGVVERLRNGDDGVEQSWTFDRRPEGSGDLVVRMRAHGESFVASDARGLHFTDRAGAGVRVGHATFVDFGGRKTDVPALWLSGDIELRVPSSVVEGARWPAVLDPTISAEAPVDAAVNTAFGPPTAIAPVVAYGNGVYVAVWADGYGAHATRIGVDGSRIDAVPISFPVPSGANSPALVFDGTRFILAYSTTTTPTSIRAVVFHADATTFDLATATPSTLVSTTASSLGTFSLATAGSVPVLAWVQYVTTGSVNQQHVFVSRVSISGTTASLLEAGNDTTASGGEWGPAIAFSGSTGWLVKQGSPGTLWKVSASTLSLSVTPTSSTIPSVITGPTVTFAGAYGWMTASHTSAPTQIWPIAADGTIGTAVSLPSSTFTYPPLLAYDGTALHAAWNDPNTQNVLTMRLSPSNGAFLDSAPIIAASLAGNVNGAGFFGTFVGTPTGHTLLAWELYLVNGMFVEATRIEGSAPADVPPLIVDNGPNRETSVAAATDGSTVLLAWSDDRNYLADGLDVYGMRLHLDGTPIDSVAFPIVKRAGDQSSPSVAWDGKTFVVGCGDGGFDAAGTGGRGLSALLVSRVGTNGAVIDATPTTLATAASGQTLSSLSLAGGAGASLAAWATSNGTLQAVRVVDGAAIDATPIVVGAGATGYSQSGHLAAFAFTNGTYVGAWYNAGAGAVFGARVGTDGSTPDHGGVALTAPQMASDLALAASPDDVLVTWNANTSSANDVFGVRVKVDGSTLAGLDAAPVPLGSAINDQRTPAVAFDGNAFVLAWVDSRDASNDVYGARVMPDGTEEGSPSGFAVSADATRSETSPAVVAAAGKTLVLYQAAPSPTSDTWRVEARTLAFSGDVGLACSSNAQCETGLCVDGFCCDRACTGQCEACDVAAHEGHCTAVSGAPHGSRTACTGTGAGTTCGISCNGVDATKCNYPPPGTVCSGNSCAAGIERHASICDGAGKCYDIPRACGAYACDAAADACNSVCTASTDCAAGFICVTNACVPAKGKGDPCTSTDTCGPGLTCTDGVCCGSSQCDPGSSCDVVGFRGTCVKVEGTECTTDAECGSGHCVDGVCCDTSCAKQCAACDVPGYVGKCIPVVGAPHGSRAACGDGGGDVCKAEACDGKDASKCAGLANGAATQCKSAVCDVDKFTAPSVCDGLGGCATPDTHSCAPYVCTANGCRSDCVTDADCAAGNACANARCVPKATAKCSDDGLSSVSADGQTTTPCAPFRCGSSGTCIKQCSSTADCVAGASCDSASQQCVTATDAGGGSSSGGCAIVGSKREGGLAIGAGALATLGVLARRRRRSS